jgi:hypothetical protein
MVRAPGPRQAPGSFGILGRLMSRLLLIVAHPELEHSRVGAALVRAAQRLARDGLTL